MARIAGVNIPENKHVEISLTHIFGIGRKTAQKICEDLKIDYTKKVSDLSEDEIKKKKQPKKFNPILIKKTDFETLIKNSQSSFWQKLEKWINTKPDFELSDSELILLRNALGIQKTFKPNLGQSIRLNNIYERALKKGFPEKL